MSSELTEPQTNTNTLTVEQIEIDILPTIYDIIRSVERDPHDSAGKTRESQDCSVKVLDLQKKLDKIRSQVALLPGIEYNKEEQLEHLDTLRKQLKLKQELLHKYRTMYSFDSMKI
uniref:Mediator of RNA polymerase II transcription subunit 9 n=1 Tax=Xenopsylla cheopis TaxID=163159 RepID=A0A6M2DNF5_XENCH